MASEDENLRISVAPSDVSNIEKGTQQTNWKPKKEEWLIMATLSISSLVVALDSTILVTVLPTLAVQLNGTAQETFWAGTSYLLANAVLQPMIASLSDEFGRKELLLPSIVLFFTGSVICSIANTFTVLLPGRVIQGVGGGGIITLTQLIFADIVPLRQRPKFFSVVLISWAIGTVVGPVLGGVLAEKSTWRWCFYINLPICVIAMTMTTFFVKLTTPKMCLKHKLGQVDWIGNFLLLSSLTSFLIAISWGGISHPWSSWQTLTPLILGSVGIAITILYEMFSSKKPFLDKALFNNPSAILSYLCALLHGISLLTALYYLTFYLTSLKSQTPVKTGISVLASLLPLLPASAVVSLLITRLSHYRIFIWIGSLIATIGSGLFLLLNAHTPSSTWTPSMAIYGLGTGMLLSSINFSVQATSAPTSDLAGRAAALYAFTRSAGMSLGVAIGGSVFQNCMQRKLTTLGLDVGIAKEAESFVAVLMAMSDGPGKDDILDAYAAGFRGVWFVILSICATGFVLSLGVRHFDLERLSEGKFRVKR